MYEGETLFNQGDNGDTAFMIINGAVDVIVDNKRVGFMKDGEVFGEMALILNQKRSATIVSNQSTELVAISKDNLKELIQSGSNETQKLIHELCEELAKRAEYQDIRYTHQEINKILESENHVVSKIAQQIFYRLEKSTNHVE